MIPNVVGRRLNEAQSILNRAGFKARSTVIATKDPQKKGRVVAQDPRAGADLVAGSTVVISIGQ